MVKEETERAGGNEMYAAGKKLFLCLRLFLVLSTAAFTQCVGYVGVPVHGEYYWDGDDDDWGDFGDDWGDFGDFDGGDDFGDDGGDDGDEGDRD